MKPSTQEELGELTVANTPAWAAATIEKYNKKGLVVDCLLWTQLIGNYNRAIIALRAEVASLKEMASPSGKFALQTRDERDAAKLEGDKLRAELAEANARVAELVGARDRALAAGEYVHQRFAELKAQVGLLLQDSREDVIRFALNRNAKPIYWEYVTHLESVLTGTYRQRHAKAEAAKEPR